MPTFIGVIFFLAALCCFLWREDCLFGLLIIAGAFEAASVMNLAGRGLQPYYLVASFTVARAIINCILGVRPKASMPQGRWLLVFGSIAIPSAFILPFIFKGTPVYDAKVGIDLGLLIHPQLSFTLTNFSQGFFLALHIATAYALTTIRYSARITHKAFNWAFYIVVFIILVQAICQLSNVSFPYSLILNNPGYGVGDGNALAVSGTRNPGTFTEPSLAGAFLVLYSIGFMAQYLSGNGSAKKVLICLIASGAVASSSSLFVLAVFMIGLLVRYAPFRFPWYINIGQSRRILLVLILIFLPAVVILAASAGYRETILMLTVSKSESISFVSRAAADLFALKLLPQTYWLGVGLGSNRASSLLTTLVSNVGVPGIFTFGIFYFRVLAGVPDVYAWFRWAAMAMFANMCIGIADITIPIFWVSILLAIHFNIAEPHSPRYDRQ